VYVFDTDVSQKMQIQQKIEAAYRKDKKSFFQNEPLPPEKYWALPFNLMIKGELEIEFLSFNNFLMYLF
jgi:hypothetical protein